MTQVLGVPEVHPRGGLCSLGSQSEAVLLKFWVGPLRVYLGSLQTFQCPEAGPCPWNPQFSGSVPVISGHQATGTFLPGLGFWWLYVKLNRVGACFWGGGRVWGSGAQPSHLTPPLNLQTTGLGSVLGQLWPWKTRTPAC